MGCSSTVLSGGGWHPAYLLFMLTRAILDIDDVVLSRCFKGPVTKPGVDPADHVPSANAPSNFRPGDWICPRPDCNNHNYASRLECRRCPERKPGSQGRDQVPTQPPTPKRDGSLGDARILFTLLTCALNADDAMSHSTGHPGQQQHHHHHGGGRGRGRGRGGGGRGRGGNRNVRQVLTEKFARARGHCWWGWPSQWCLLERRRRLHHVLPRCTAVRSRAPTAVY